MKLKRNLVLLTASILLIGCKPAKRVSIITPDSLSSVSSSVESTETGSHSSETNSSTTVSSQSSNSKGNSSSTTSRNSTNVDKDYTGYYSSIKKGMNGVQLQSELNSITGKNYKIIAYGDLKDVAYKTTDCYPGTSTIWDMYSNEKYSITKTGGNSSEGAGWNKEHSIPQSYFNESSPMKSDLFHVYPTDAYVNNMRSNYPYGEVSSAKKTSKNGSKLGSSAISIPSYSGLVFEPIDEYKGDFARTYFYFATRYPGKATVTSNGKVSFNNTFPYLTDYCRDLMIKWHEQDPVSQKEIDRNNAVYAIQKNRNPFIDYPEFADVIFGSKTSIDKDYDKNSSSSESSVVTSSSESSVTPSSSEISTVSSSESSTVNSSSSQTVSSQSSSVENQNSSLVCSFGKGATVEDDGIVSVSKTKWKTSLKAMQIDTSKGGAQFPLSSISGSSNKQLELSYTFNAPINKVTLSLSTNSSNTDKIKLNVSVNGENANEENVTLSGKDLTDYVFNFSNAPQGEIKIIVSTSETSKSIYLSKISIN